MECLKIHLYFILILYLFQKTSSNNEIPITYKKYSQKEVIKLINNIIETEEEYNQIISKINEVLSDYYIYIDILKNPPDGFDKIDIIEKLKSINTKKMSYYDFYKNISSILYSIKDYHLNFIFNNINQYTYLSPIYYEIKTEENVNNLYLRLSKNIEYFNDKENLKKKILKYNNKKIKTINGINKFDYIQNFGNFQFIRDEQAQFSFNLKYIEKGYLNYYFFKDEELEKIKIEFEEGEPFEFSYIFLTINNTSKEFKSYYEKEMEKYKKIRFKPTIIDIEEKYLKSKNLTKEKLNETIIWDIIIEGETGELKFRVDNKNKVNVFYQNTFDFVINEQLIEKLNKISNKTHENDYPIILIESNNEGGDLQFPILLEKLINYKLATSKIILSYKYSNKMENYFPNEAYIMNSSKCEKISKKNFKKHIKVVDYENGINHIITETIKISIKTNYSSIINFNQKRRNATQIIIFTDGLLFSSGSLFMNSIQESGNAIIIGYNGNPSNKKKDIKFEASQSPSYTNYNIDDENIKYLKNKNIIVQSITCIESFSDIYLSRNYSFVPREFDKNLIDERSNIFGEYNDLKYDNFINESKRYLNKYINNCNDENLNLVLLNDSCDFLNKYSYGGNTCKNGTWSGRCKITYCDEEFEYNTYLKNCKTEKCIYKNVFTRFKFEIIFLSVFITFLFFYFICKSFVKKKSKNNKEDIYLIEKEIMNERLIED